MKEQPSPYTGQEVAQLFNNSELLNLEHQKIETEKRLGEIQTELRTEIDDERREALNMESFTTRDTLSVLHTAIREAQKRFSRPIGE